MAGEREDIARRRPPWGAGHNAFSLAGVQVRCGVKVCAQCSSDATEVMEAGKRPGRDWSGPDDEEVLRMPVVDWGPASYSSAPDQPLLGVPIREGSLWHLAPNEGFEEVSFGLYVNGFVFGPPGGQENTISLSPFSLVRNCRFQSGVCSRFKTFRVSLLDHSPCCYFAVRSLCEREAERERSEWVLGISHAIFLIIDSLLPAHQVTCDPLLDAPQTLRRLIAGYLIHRDTASSVSVVFCELQAHRGNRARLAIYEDESCSNELLHLDITEESTCMDVLGINCSFFIIDGHHFASQTPSERKLWLRALANVKIKVGNLAPEPSQEELEAYRSSIREHIRALETAPEFRIAAGDPLLTPWRSRRFSAGLECTTRQVAASGDRAAEPSPPPDPALAKNGNGVAVSGKPCVSL